MITTNTKTFQYFQSANTSFKEIKQNFVVRLKEFDLLRSNLFDDEMQDSVQHFLILGRRGSGKSTLLKRIEGEVDENKILNDKYISINFAEEQASIHRLFDLFEEIIRTLKCNFGFENLPDTDTIDIPDDYSEYSRDLYHHIQSALQSCSKKLLLLIDNIDKIFLGIKEDAQILREILLNYDDIKIIGGSTRMGEHFWQYDLPFYQFFRILKLESLTSEEIRNLLISWSQRLEIQELEEFVKTKPGQLEAIRILTDGMPRTLQFFVDLLINRPQQNGYAYIQKIMDMVTPLYQERLNSLLPIEQKIVLRLAFIWEAASIRDLVKPTKIESKLLSANLKKLSDNKIVDTIPTGKKNHLYRLSERFFNMWLIVTQGNPMEKRKARWLTIFLENFYGQKEIKQIVKNHLKDLKSGRLKEDHLTLMTKALSQSKYTSFEERDLLIEQNLSIPTLDESLKLTLPSKSTVITEKIQKLINEKKFSQAAEEVKGIPNEVDGMKDLFWGKISYLSGNIEDAETYFKKSLYKGNSKVYVALAALYSLQEKKDLVEENFLKAIEEGDKKAIFPIGLFYFIEDKYDLALKYLLLASKENFGKADYYIGFLYRKQNENEQALKYFLKAVNYGETKALKELASLYEKQDRLDLAVEYYKKAIENGDGNLYKRLAIVYEKLNDDELAEKYYLQAIENKQKEAKLALAHFYLQRYKYDQSEKYFRHALSEGNEEAIFGLAISLQQQNKYKLAVKYYNDILDSKKKYTPELLKLAVNGLALIYDEMGNYELAEKYYQRAIELGEIDVEENLLELYYLSVKNKTKLKYLLDNLLKESIEKRKYFILEKFWSGEIDDIQSKVFELAKEKGGIDEMFLTHLLVHHQKNLVWKLFNDAEEGTRLKNKFAPLYYATSQLIDNKESKLNLLKIPPEIEETVQEILTKIEKLRKEYYPDLSI